MKLNLGCGHNRIDGFWNVDKHEPADQLVDLERRPWPWHDNSVDHVVAIHVMEHLGASPDVFLGVMSELYRVCAHQAKIELVVPSPWHDDFVNDPTHVRPITPEMLALFSKAACDRFREMGASNTPLAHQLGVDFQILHIEYVLDQWAREIPRGASLDRMMTTQRNVVKEIKIIMQPNKQARAEGGGMLDIKVEGDKVTAKSGALT